MLGTRKRQRKRGSAEPIRCYNYHINLRLTYFEAEVLHRVLSSSDYKPTHSEAAAANRAAKKVALAAQADQWEEQRKNIARRLKRLTERHEAQRASGISVDVGEKMTVRYLKERLENDLRVGERMFKLS